MVIRNELTSLWKEKMATSYFGKQDKYQKT